MIKKPQHFKIFKTDEKKIVLNDVHIFLLLLLHKYRFKIVAYQGYLTSFKHFKVFY